MFGRTKPLAGYRFLVVEDEMLQALRIGDLVKEMGGDVTDTAYGFEQARRAIAAEGFDCAVLDINLGGTLSFRLTDALKEQKIPFVFCTAYADGIEVYPGASDAPRVDKPVQPAELCGALLMALRNSKRG
jgi:CheY-like chemotaxis protein